jgi:hypothetical protein
MLFMSQEHVDEMNRILAADTTVLQSAAKLDRPWTMLYRLTNGPDGGMVFWSTQFSPSGVVFGLEQTPADLTFDADWRETVDSSRAARDGITKEQDVKVGGDPAMLEAITEVFALSREVATLPVDFP